MLTVLLIILVVLLLPLFLPVGVAAHRKNERHKWYVIFAGIRFPFKLKSSGAIQKRIKKTTADPLAHLSVMQASALEIWEYFEGELPQRLWRTLRRYLSCLHLKIREFNLRIGSENPATAGLAYGAACATAGMLPRSIPVEFSVDFESHRTELSYRIALTIIPAKLIFEVLRSLITLRAWAILRILRAAKLQNKSSKEIT